MVPRRQKTLLLLMLGALGVLLVGQLLSAAGIREPETAVAQRYSGEGPVYISGVVIRREIPLTAETRGSWMPQVDDGEKVAANQELFVWETPQGLENAACTVRLLRAGQQAENMPVLSRREEIHGAIARLNTVDETDRRVASEALTGLLLGETGELAPRLRAAENVLMTQNAQPAQSIRAPEAGIFAAAADGLETVLTPETPWAEWPLPPGPADTRTLGRLVLGDTWYYRTVLPFAPEAGDTLEARLLGGIFQTVPLTVETVRPQKDGWLTLMSCGTALAEVADIRQLAAKILPDSESGVEIPAEAVYTVEGETGVWCLVGEAARFKPVTILKKLGDTVVVELDQSTTENLWPGDVVLLDYQ